VSLTYFHQFWLSYELQGLNRKTPEFGSHTTTKRNAIQLRERSNKAPD